MNKKEIKEMVQEAVQESLTVEVTYEQHIDPETGQPLSTVKLKKENEFLPIWWMRYLPRYEAAMRGMQETQDKQSNKILELTNEIKDLKQGMSIIGEIMLQTEQSLKHITFISDNIKRIPKEETIQIES